MQFSLKESVSFFDEVIIEINKYFHKKTKQLQKPLKLFSTHIQDIYPHAYLKEDIQTYWNNDQLFKNDRLEIQWSKLISNPNVEYVCVPLPYLIYEPRVFLNDTLVYDLRDKNLSWFSGFKFYKSDLDTLNYWLSDYYSTWSSFMKTTKHLLGFWRLLFNKKLTKQKIYLNHPFYDTFLNKKQKFDKLFFNKNNKKNKK